MGRFAISLWLISSAVWVHPGLAGNGPSRPLGHFSLHVDSIPGAAQGVLPSVSAPPRNGNPGAGYGIGLRYNYMKSLSGGVEVRRHDYFVDDNLKAERPRNSVMFTMGLHF